MDTVKMYGPGISDPTKTVNRDVPKCDVQAYKAAGYVEGSIEEEVVEAVEAPAKPTKGKPKGK